MRITGGKQLALESAFRDLWCYDYSNWHNTLSAIMGNSEDPILPTFVGRWWGAFVLDNYRRGPDLHLF